MSNQCVPVDAEEFARLRESRDELLVALQTILALPSDLEYHVNESGTCELCKAVERAKSAIARATPAALKAQAS